MVSILWGVNTATVITYQTFIVVKFDYLKYNENEISKKQKLQNSTKAMYYSANTIVAITE